MHVTHLTLSVVAPRLLEISHVIITRSPLDIQWFRNLQYEEISSHVNLHQIYSFMLQLATLETSAFNLACSVLLLWTIQFPHLHQTFDFMYLKPFSLHSNLLLLILFKGLWCGKHIAGHSFLKCGSQNRFHFESINLITSSGATVITLLNHHNICI